jgi:hypothetical protein
MFYCITYTGPLSVQAQYSTLCPISSNVRYNGSLDSCGRCLTASKFRPLILLYVGLHPLQYCEHFHCHDLE